MDEWKILYPDSLIMWAVPVPSVPIRPSVQEGQSGGSTEDDITEYTANCRNEQCVIPSTDTRGHIQDDCGRLDYMQAQVALFINGDVPGIPRSIAGTRFTRLCQRPRENKDDLEAILVVTRRF